MDEKTYMCSLQRLLNKQKYQSVYPGIYAGVQNWGFRVQDEGQNLHLANLHIDLG